MPTPEPEFIVDVSGAVIGAEALIADGKAVEVDGKLVPAEPVLPVEPAEPVEPVEPTPPAEG